MGGLGSFLGDLGRSQVVSQGIDTLGKLDAIESARTDRNIKMAKLAKDQKEADWKATTKSIDEWDDKFTNVDKEGSVALREYIQTTGIDMDNFKNGIILMRIQ